MLGSNYFNDVSFIHVVELMLNYIVRDANFVSARRSRSVLTQPVQNKDKQEKSPQLLTCWWISVITQELCRAATCQEPLLRQHWDVL